MRSPPVLYSEALEGFFLKGVGKRLSVRGRHRLKEAGLDLDQKLKPAYPLESYRGFMEIAREDLYPFQPKAEGFRRLGEDTVKGYGETVIGKALLSVARLVGPLRLLTRMDTTARGVNNFTQTRITQLGERNLHYWFNELSVTSDYTVGLIVGALEAAGAKGLQVDYLADTEPHTFHLRWD